MDDRDLLAIRDAGLITQPQFESISAFLQKRNVDRAQLPRFDLTHVLWYAGALIIMGALGLFTNEAFNRLGAPALVACGAAYAVASGIAGHMLWNRPGLRTPGGLLISVAVAMVPLIVYGIQDWLQLWDYAKGDPGQYRNFFPYVHGSWLYMELATVAAALAAARVYRFPFIMMVAATALWFMSMDLAVWFTRVQPEAGTYTPYDYEFDIRRKVSLVFGLVMMLAAWIADIRRKGGPDMTFWIHIAGATAFWGGLSLTNGGTQPEKLAYCLINVGLLGYSLFLNRRIYAVYGAFGVAGYLGYLASDVFRDAILFSFALSAIGIGIIAAGIYTHRNRDRLKQWFDGLVPAGLQRLRPET